MPHISYSQLACFVRCPKQYYLKRVIGVQVDEGDPKYRYIGSVLQALIEKFYREELWTQGNLAYDILQWSLPAISDALVAEERNHFVFEDPSRREEADARVISLMFKALNTIKTERLIGIEHLVEHELVLTVGDYTVHGRADLIIRAPDTSLGILDGKAGASTPDQDQLRLYSLACDETLHQLPTRVGFWRYAKGKVCWKKVQPKVLVHFLEGLTRTLERIDSGEQQAQVGKACRSCDFRPGCPEGQAHVMSLKPSTSGIEVPTNGVGVASF